MDGRVRLRADEVVAREVDGQVVALNLGTSTYLNVNAAGTVLWRVLESAPASVSDLAAVLRERFELEPQDAARDAEAFVDDLVSHGLAEPVGDDG